MEYETPDIAQDLQMLQELAARNRTPQMRAILQRVMPQHPDHHDVLYYSAQVDWLEDKDEDALATVSQLVERYPESYWGACCFSGFSTGSIVAAKRRPSSSRCSANTPRTRCCMVATRF